VSGVGFGSQAVCGAEKVRGMLSSSGFDFRPLVGAVEDPEAEVTALTASLEL
jgi:hypothetical protein